MKLIIPCAGFGTRCNMPTDKSKELLINPDTKKPLISHALNIANVFNITPLIITRPEKTDLIDYAKEHNIELLVTEPGEEWAATVLKSEPLWDENNILVLPDTVFPIEPIGLIKYMICDSETDFDVVFGTHKVEDGHNWGVIHYNFAGHSIIEKPQYMSGGSNYDKPANAWGVIAFKKRYGNELFSAMQKKNNPLYLKSWSAVELGSFRDLTRNGKIE